MKPIEIRLDPALVESLLEAIGPVLELLNGELASPAAFPEHEEDELLEDFWKTDLLNSQREEIAIMRGLFGEDFMDTGRAFIDPEDMDKVLRACSAIRLKLRETMLAPINDGQLEEGNFEGLDWTDEMQIGYAAYALFASLQELIVAQITGELPDDSDASDDWSDGDEDLEDER